MSLSPLVAVWNGVSLWLLFRQWRMHRRPPDFVWVLFPSALLFLTVPIPLTVGNLLKAFERIAQEGQGGLATILPFCLEIANELRVGAAGFLVTMVSAGAVQVYATRARHQPEMSQGTASTGFTWRGGMVVTSTLLIIPVALLVNVTAAIARLVVDLGVRLSASADSLTPEAVEQYATTVANQSLVAFLGAALLTVILGGLGLANLIARQSTHASDTLTRYSWVLVASAGVWALWTLVQLTRDIDSFQRALS